MPKAEHELRNELRVIITAAGSPKAAAIRLGISQQYLHDVLCGRRHIGRKLASALGYYPERVYVPFPPSKATLPA